MVANVAFLAALTTFLAVAWLAGELSFLAPFKAGDLRNHGSRLGVGHVAAVLNCAPRYDIAPGCSCATPGASSRTGPSLGRDTPC